MHTEEQRCHEVSAFTQPLTEGQGSCPVTTLPGKQSTLQPAVPFTGPSLGLCPVTGPYLKGHLKGRPASWSLEEKNART